MSEIKNVDLDAPAFGKNAATIDADSTSETTSEVSQTKELGQDDAELVTRKVDESKEETTEEESEEEQKIPYSRFKTIADQKRQAEQEALEANERYERLLNDRREREQSAEKPEDEKLLDYMIKLYGDNENTRAAYKVELERIEYIEKRAEERALRSIEEARTNETKSLQKNEEVIDNNLEDLSNYIGRPLTEKEEAGILEIVDEYTPKDEDGNYSGDLLPFDKAYEIYEMKNQSRVQSNKKARSTATRVTSNSSEGEPSGLEKQNKEFNPLNWNAYRSRI